MTQTSDPKPARPWFKKKRFTIPLAFLVILVAMSLFGPKNPDAAKSPATPAQPATSPTPKPKDTQTPTPAAVKTPAPEEAKVPAEYKSALGKAQTYSDMMHMCKARLYEQLVSEHGEKFSTAAAKYAVDNVPADWNKNALQLAKTYQETMNMSPKAIRDQLVSTHGERCTPEQADYAIKHLND